MPFTKLLIVVFAAVTLLIGSTVVRGDEHQTLALFDGIQDSVLDAKFIPIDSKRANLLIQNQTQQDVFVELPDAIAAVPVLAQFGFNQQQGQQQGQGAGGNQSVGGAAQGQNFGQNFGQQAGGFRIAPGKTRKVKVTTVCLEHGKPDPNPKVAYRLMPIDQYTQDARVAELCKQLGQRAVSQKVAQAAAWHLANELSWAKLAQINRLESRYLGNIPYFTSAELTRAKSWVGAIEKEAMPNIDDEKPKYALSETNR